MTNGYIEHLRKRQIAEGWTDTQMAAEMRVPYTTWFYIANGERQPGMSFIRRAMHRFPEYDMELLLNLRAEAAR